MSLQKSRAIFAGAVACFLVLCNLAYLFATSQQKQSEFAAKMDQPPIQILSLLLLGGVVAFACLKPEAQPEENE